MQRTDLLARIQWHVAHRPEWNDAPWSYVDAGLVRTNKSRRLGKLEEPGRAFRAYLGVQYAESAAIWGPSGSSCRFFVSLWFRGRVVVLHSHPTMAAALDQLWAFYQRLPRPMPSAASDTAKGGGAEHVCSHTRHMRSGLNGH